MTRRTRLALWTVYACGTLAIACSGGPSAKPPAPHAPLAPKALSGHARAQWYLDCWDNFNTRIWDAFKECYGESAEADPGDSGRPADRGPDAIVKATQQQSEGFPDLRGDPQLVLVNGSHIASVSVLSGSHTQPMTRPDGSTLPATNRHIGLLFGHLVQTDETGLKVVKESNFMDSSTMLSQLGVLTAPARPVMRANGPLPEVVVASSSDTEKTNVEVSRKSIADWNRHGAPAILMSVAEDLVWHDAAASADMDRNAFIASLKALWKGMSNAKITPIAVWGAANYTVLQGVLEGTNDGDLPSMKIRKTGRKVRLHFLEIDRLEGGKLKEGWLFYDGGALVRQLGKGL